MILAELLNAIQYDQMLRIYLTNDYDQNLPIAVGVKNDMFCDPDAVYDLFYHYGCKVETIAVTQSKAIVIKVVDENRCKRLEEQYPEEQCHKWKQFDKSTRPFLWSCEIER